MLNKELRHGTVKEDTQILEKETAYQGFFRVNVFRLRHRLFNGEWSKELTREVCGTGGVAGVLLFDPKQKKVIIIEQFRIALLEDEQGPWSLEIVAGLQEESESAESLAVREAKEEANADVIDLIPIYNYWVSPGTSSKRMALFCGIIDSTNLGGIHGLAEEDEDIRVHIINVDEAFQMVKTGKINNSLGIIALQWLELNLHRFQ